MDYKEKTKLFKVRSTIIEMLTEQGAPKHENIELLVNDSEFRFTHLTMALKESDDFISQLETRLTELCVIADSLKINNVKFIKINTMRLNFMHCFFCKI